MSKKTTVPSIEDRFNAGVDHAAHWAAPKVEAALAWAERGLGEGKVQGRMAGEMLAPQVKAGLAQANSAFSDAVEKVSPQVQAQLDRLSPALDQARSKVEHDYLPAASARLAGVAGQASKAAHGAKISPAVENALINITGDKKAVKKLRKAAEQYASAAEKQLKKQAKKSNKGGKGWLVAGVIVAAGAAAVAVWQLTKPVEDPWKTPAPAPLPKPAAPAPAASTGTDPDLTAEAPSAPVAPAAGTPAPSVAAGNATVDSVDGAEEKVQGIPAPKSAE
ncbi:hypothetical protein AB0K08_00270 [Citricoccus sp. NPDC055426]|uniref:hypothetical protein n=1 Tax=Citricoccus sp. NPDC055426 TaxID=3155536 RepID=UPI00341AB10E